MSVRKKEKRNNGRYEGKRIDSWSWRAQEIDFGVSCRKKTQIPELALENNQIKPRQLLLESHRED